jgi:hypothetical protein
MKRASKTVDEEQQSTPPHPPAMCAKCSHWQLDAQAACQKRNPGNYSTSSNSNVQASHTKK